MQLKIISIRAPEVFYKAEYICADKSAQKKVERLNVEALSFHYEKAAKLLAARPADYIAGYVCHLYIDADILRAEKWQAVEAFFKILEALQAYPADNESLPSKAAEVLTHIEVHSNLYAPTIKNIMHDANNEDFHGLLQAFELMAIMTKIVESYRTEPFSFFQKF